MGEQKGVKLDSKLLEKCELFQEQVTSNMYFQAEVINDALSFDWVAEIELICPYLDNIIRNPKLALINEEDTVKIEKAKKISVASIKDLSKHTHYIDKIDPITEEVQPSKILIERREETYNTYENRFIYTLITNLYRFITEKEALLDDFETKNNKILEYSGKADSGQEKINIELKVGTRELPQGKNAKAFKAEIMTIRERVKKISDYLLNWRRSEFMESLEKARVPFVYSPIRKTNMILKNPNFQMAMQLWEFLQSYDYNEDKAERELSVSAGDEYLKGVLDDAFLINYLVLNAISTSKKQQQENIAKSALVMFQLQVQRALALLLKSGVELTESEILELITAEIKKEQTQRIASSDDVKSKFKKEMSTYLDKIKEYM